jgi:aspartyl-tRNA(Asn)/glutamyl-tRNA(Gln) amidotransferase subunit B
LLPAARRQRLAAATGTDPNSDAVATIVERGQDGEVLSVGEAGGDIGRALVYAKEAFADGWSVPVADLAALTRLEVDGAVTASQAKQILGEMVAAGGGDPAAIAAAKGFEAMDTSLIDGFVDQAIAADPDAWAKFCAGESKAMGALVGQVMKLSRGKADGKAVSAALNARKSGSTPDGS